MAEIVEPTPSIEIPQHLLQKLCETDVTRIRDAVNGYHGRERLSVHLLRQESVDIVDVLFDDTDAPEDHHVYVEWKKDLDVDAVVDMIVQQGLQENI